MTSICFGPEAEKVPGFDHLQRLVEHRGTVDRNLQAHRPVRVGARGFHRHIRHVTQRGGAEGATRRRQDDPLDGVALVLFQHLEDGVVLAVDRKQPAAARPDRCDEEIAGRYQAFLVGKGDIGAAAGRGKRRRQAGSTDDCRHHPVSFAVGGFHQPGFSRSDRDAGAGKCALQ